MRFPVSCSREHTAADSFPAADTRAEGRAMFDSAGPPGHTPFRSSRCMAPAEEAEDPQVSRPRLPVSPFTEQPCSSASGLRSRLHGLRQACMAVYKSAHKRQLQGAGDMAADDGREEAEEAGRSGALGPCDADAGSGLDVPSSSNGRVPHLQLAGSTKHRRIGLPEHARMVAELQVRCSAVMHCSGQAVHDAEAMLGSASAIQCMRVGVASVEHEHQR